MTKTVSLMHYSLQKLAHLILNREITALELLNQTLEKLQRVNPSLNAITFFDAEQARQHAMHCDEMLANGKSLGPLHGIPLTIKDSINVEKMPTTDGVKTYEAYIPEHEAVLVTRLRAAGAIVVAKTNVPEFVFAGETDNLLHGRTNNPYDLDKTPGGSSGGEAAVIASGAVPAGVGSDMLGSLRIPAHYCGLATIRPTVGRVPTTFIANDHPLGFDTALKGLISSPGPMAKYVDDLELLLNIMSGPDGIDPHCVAAPPICSAAIDVASLKIGYFVSNDLFAVDESTEQLFVKVLAALKADHIDHILHQPIFTPDIMTVFKIVLRGFDGKEMLQKKIADAGVTKISHHLQLALNYISAQDAYRHNTMMTMTVLDLYRSQFLQYLSAVDVLICPVLPFAALDHNRCLWEFDLADSTSYLAYSSFAQSTSAVVRVGSSLEGMPMGVQMIAKPWQEDKVLAVAKYFEQKFGGWQPPRM